MANLPPGRETLTLVGVYERIIVQIRWATLSFGRGVEQAPPNWNPCSHPRHPYYQFQIRMDPVLSPVIYEILPTEILEIIFDEHEWEAPTIDGRVCRLWRRIVLNTPRVWAYLKIPKFYEPSMGELRLQLHRSSLAPLHIESHTKRRNDCERLYNLFSDHCTRIISLRMPHGSKSFFEGLDFPCMRLLDVAYWYTVRWGSTPKLQHLYLGAQQWSMVRLSELAPLKILALSCFNCMSFLRHSQSLTTLMLRNVHLMDVISSPVTFPSLTYLSLFGVRGLKPHVNAPRLVTYHEEGLMASESFSISLPSLVEYGAYQSLASSSDPATLHLTFPNIQRLAIRADDFVLLSFFTSLASQPYSLPALQTISAGSMHVVHLKSRKESRRR